MRFQVSFDEQLQMSLSEWTPHTANTPLHWHSFMEVGVCLSGRGQFHFEHISYPVEAGDVFLATHLERHMCQADAEDPSRYIFIHFSPSVLMREEIELLMPFACRSPHISRRIQSSETVAGEIRTLVERMLIEQSDTGEFYRQFMKHSLTIICILLSRYYRKALTPEAWNKQKLRLEQLQPALDYILEHFREPIRLEHIAEQLYLSSSRTRHLFIEVVGRGFKEYLLQLRIDEAKSLLVNTDRTILDIVFLCGFQSQAAFYETFRRLVGQTPGEYRNGRSQLSRFPESIDIMLEA
ncbi:AraC family transcriptional regulator [Paenibacillus sp. GCM10023252]|uniref:AraC family transcriptional regulator n=1 Tax=Paenibacillus sp. GCM10023252 TaxID=3252649 RepID=UPI003611EAED